MLNKELLTEMTEKVYPLYGENGDFLLYIPGKLLLSYNQRTGYISGSTRTDEFSEVLNSLGKRNRNNHFLVPKYHVTAVVHNIKRAGESDEMLSEEIARGFQVSTMKIFKRHQRETNHKKKVKTSI
ncbi:MAG: hypothetical protein KKF56_03235 [Nanoarchaeota archaeon]|nr:hypothetical protein [Nanoarchaeota archaeon]